MPPKSIDEYYTAEESFPDQVHVIAAHDAATDAFEVLDDMDQNRNEVIRAHKHIEQAIEILEKTDIID